MSVVDKITNSYHGCIYWRFLSNCGVAAANTILLQPVLSWTSSFVVPMAHMSRLTQSIHLCFVLPLFVLFLLPAGTISRVFLPTYSWSRLKPPQSCFPAPLCDIRFNVLLQCYIPWTRRPDIPLPVGRGHCPSLCDIRFNVLLQCYIPWT